MLPRTKFDDVTESLLGQAELPCQVAPEFSRRTTCANRPNVILGKRRRVVFATWASPPLGLHVGVVVDNRSQKQVIRPDAPRIVASMEHPLSGGNDPEVQLPGQAMCEHLTTATSGHRAQTDLGVRRSHVGVFPTTRALCHLGPKPLRERHLMRPLRIEVGATHRAPVMNDAPPTAPSFLCASDCRAFRHSYHHSTWRKS